LPTKRRNRQKEDKQEQEALDPAAVTPVTSVPTSVTEQQGPGQDSVEHGKQINDSQYQKQ